jgi:hypothetical protein
MAAYSMLQTPWGCLYTSEHDPNDLIYITGKHHTDYLLAYREYLSGAPEYATVADVLLLPHSVYPVDQKLLDSIPHCKLGRPPLSAARFAASNIHPVTTMRQYIEKHRPPLLFVINCFFRIGQTADVVLKLSSEFDIKLFQLNYMFNIENMLCRPDGPIIIPVPGMMADVDLTTYEAFDRVVPNLVRVGQGKYFKLGKSTDPKSDSNHSLDMQTILDVLLKVSSRKHIETHHQELLTYSDTHHKDLIWKLPMLFILVIYYHKSNRGDVCRLINTVLQNSTTYLTLLEQHMLPSHVARNRVLRVASGSPVLPPRQSSSQELSTQAAIEFQLYPFKVNYTIQDLQEYPALTKGTEVDVVLLGIDKLVSELGDDSVFVTSDLVMEHSHLNKSRLKEISRLITPNIRLIIIPIQYGTFTSGHSNLVVIDVLRRESEHYEPNGAVAYIAELVETVIRYAFPWIENHYTPIDYEASCNLQDSEKIRYAKEYEKGYCLTWSFVYAVHRILYPNISRSDLIKLLMDHTTRAVYEMPTQPKLMDRWFSAGNINRFEYARRAAAWLVDVYKTYPSWQETRLAFPPVKDVFSVEGSLSRSSRSKSKSKSKTKSNNAKSHSRSNMPMSRSFSVEPMLLF